MSERIHVAIVGSGPSGFYAADTLLKTDLPFQIDMFERLPTPFGLVRSGVAPDHQKLKQSIQAFEQIAQSPSFTFVGNVSVGTDVTVEQLRSAYHAVIFACGAQNDRSIGIPGEDLAGSHTATEFVGWYNGHPDYRDRTFDLQQEVVAIVGQGNVAADVCRILMRPVDELRSSDIAEHALDALANSRVKEVHVIGRRGPVQAKFTTKELRELANLSGVVATIDSEQLKISETCRAELAHQASANAKKNFDLFQGMAVTPPAGATRRIHFHFMASPKELRGSQRVEALTLARNRLAGGEFAQYAVSTGEEQELACGLVFRSIGYKGKPMPGLPFDASKGVLPNRLGRLVDGDAALQGLYVTGWLKRGPSGIIGTNRADSIETVEALLEDLRSGALRDAVGLAAVEPLIRTGQRIVSFNDWRAIDAAEVARGASRGKPREKFTRIDEMLACCP
ncbi:Ferredoxin--NADP(+) reductase, actinobacterial (eukaryote-like) type [Hyphomicrobium sulfonivorans]|uniref:Ferredoxin--NADP(+) reductase, actinobacterial (Eukaryote-like) type n=1 Tax=Hyphomicrobium sulfonivorans TaxID=121290 RepID=A0A109BQE8_HYPSL|nr:FAD-dependent oxidoreductase [Hyphomicrobium sulfonivorans]KWT72969.1 Ferredoxin--NADP(+) reductase, actinobacterial (eukaryote-like) type [Hyphomicrobium sulfonivorans]